MFKSNCQKFILINFFQTIVFQENDCFMISFLVFKSWTGNVSFLVTHPFSKDEMIVLRKNEIR